jgi:hypothetical protein
MIGRNTIDALSSFSLGSIVAASTTRYQQVTRQQLLSWKLLWISLLCCVLEGAARKWAVGDASIAGRLAYLSKYLVMFGFFAGIPLAKSQLSALGKPFLAMGLTLLTVGAALSSTAGVEPVGAVVTFLNFLFLPAAAWLAGRRLPADALLRMARWISIFTLFMAPLGVLQFYAPSGSRINRYSTEGEYVATAGVSQRVRATGTFSYITGMGEFGALGVWAGIVTFTTARTRAGRWLGYAALVGALCCAFVTVSRSAALGSLAIVAVWAFLSGGVGAKMKSTVMVGIVALCALVIGAQWDAATEIGTTVYLRHENQARDSLNYRLWYQFIRPLDAIWMAPFGNGVGSEQASRTALSGSVRGGLNIFESPWGRTVMEVGVLGLIGFLATWGLVIAPWAFVYRTWKMQQARTVLTVTAAALAVRGILGFQFNHTAAFFFWSTAACILALGNPRLTRSTSPPTQLLGMARSQQSHNA